MYCSQIISLWMKLLHNHPFKLILTVTSKLLMTFCVRDKIQKNDLEFGEHFEKIKAADEVKCQHCSKIYNYHARKTDTSSLLYHLDRCKSYLANENKNDIS